MGIDPGPNPILNSLGSGSFEFRSGESASPSVRHSDAVSLSLSRSLTHSLSPTLSHTHTHSLTNTHAGRENRFDADDHLTIHTVLSVAYGTVGKRKKDKGH